MPDQTPTLQLTWSWLVVIYLFIAGVGAGAYLTSFWAGRRGWSERVVSVGRYLAAPLVIIGTGMLVFDLGAGKTNPLRIFGLFTHPSSMMSLGTWLLSVFIILAVIDGYSPLLEKIPRWHGKVPRFTWLSVVTAVFALCVAVYTSLLIGVVGAIPFWNSPILPVLFVVSALSTGLVATLAGAVVVSRKSADLSLGNFGPIHIGLLSIEMVVVFLFLFFAGMSHQAPVTFSFHAVVTGPFAASFWIGLVVVGLAVPLVYNLLAHRTSLAAKLHAPGFVLAESLCVLVGGFMLRYLIVFAGSVGHVFVTIPG